MNVPNKFISPLDEDLLNDLNDLVKNSQKARVRQRAQAIILSSKQLSIDEIAEICGVVRNTVSAWIDNWEQLGLDGLHDKDRPGGPPKLNTEEKEFLLNLARETPRSVANMITALFEETGKLLSESTIKRLLTAAGLKWKRIRKTTKKKPNPDEFEAARNEIDELKEQHENGELELWFFDETGFDLEPKVPYAWQPIGETIEVACSKSSRLNVLGFLTPDNEFESFTFECSVDTDIVIAVFDKFAEKTTKKRVIIIDNAPIHTSGKFLAKIKEWEEKGLFLKFLPTYSPKLNIIEILWRFIKYEWLPVSAYSSFKQLVIEVEKILIQIGERFKINFAN
jgi:transposase